MTFTNLQGNIDEPMYNSKQSHNGLRPTCDQLMTNM